MLPTVLEAITLADIQRLVDDGVQEAKRIEYKGGLYQFVATDQKVKAKEHREFLKDVSSFANTHGGDLIIGVEAKSGIPQRVVGIEEPDPDNLKLRLSQLLENWLEPRVGAAMHAIPLGGNRHVLVIRVSRSIAAPHRVIYANEPGPFFGRNAAGAFSMDTEQLRQAFTLSQTALQRITAFRHERVRKTLESETPIPLPQGAKIYLHLIPLEAFTGSLVFSAADLQDAVKHLPTLGGTAGGERFNVDGILRSNYREFSEASHYVQVFRNGIIEAISSDAAYQLRDSDIKTYFLSTHFEQRLLERLPQYLGCQKTLGVPLPIWCFITYTGVKNVEIRRERYFESFPPIDRHTLSLPEVEITSYDAEPLPLLRPLFDMTWNAAGWPKCCSFNDAGEWSS